LRPSSHLGVVGGGGVVAADVYTMGLGFFWS
jgi:hypothetical protein